MNAHVPVLIVGGGPVGLALACELGWRGVRCLFIERRDGSINHPKMNQVGIRTMEFCRRWGVAAKVRSQSIPEDFPRNYFYVTATTGYELARYEFPSRSDTPLEFSPEALQRCSQLWFDPILRERAASFPAVEMRYETKLDAFDQDGEGVTAALTDLKTGRKARVRADYLAACDGAESAVREALGIDLLGDSLLSYNVNVFFRSADRVALLAKGRAVMQWIFGPEGMWADIVAVDGKQLWRLSIMRLAPGTEVTREEAAKRIRQAVGRDLSFEIVSILPWARRRVVAERFSQGRVFLCGDAAHQMSPTGGFGMNTGIQEAVDLGWKLAAVIEGWGGARLLQSFDLERRPVAIRTTNEGARNYLQFLKLPVGPEIHDDSPEGAALRQRIGDMIRAERFDREYTVTGVTLGYRYEGSPLIVPDGTDEPPDDPMVYVPTARPGHRAPHAWLPDGRSVLDLFGRGFTLLRLGEQPAPAGALIGAAKRQRVPLDVVDVSGREIHELYERRLVLVRPEGHVAWRGNAEPENPATVMTTVRGANAFEPP